MAVTNVASFPVTVSLPRVLILRTLASVWSSYIAFLFTVRVLSAVSAGIRKIAAL